MRLHDGPRILRTVAAVLIAAAGLLLTTSAASAAGAPRLVEAAGSSFPNLSYVLTLSTKRSLALSQVHVTENGRPVRGLSLVSEQAASQSQFAVVFLIDASLSMRGKPIVAAMSAVRTFEENRNAGQSVALIVFNRGVRVLLPFTTDASRISAALDHTPRLDEGTRIYDALGRARELLEGTRAASGSIVLLSDGTDVGSVAKPATVLHALAADRLRVFSVGLKSRTYDRRTLAGAAAATGGSYVEAAKPSALTGIFGALGASLSNQYVISYSSLANPGKHIAVRVAVDGVPGAAVAAYLTPALRIVPAPPYHPSQVAKVVAVAVHGVRRRDPDLDAVRLGRPDDCWS